MTKYKVVTNFSPTLLDEEVGEWIKKGWSLYGGLGTNPTPEGIEYFQVLSC